MAQNFRPRAEDDDIRDQAETSLQQGQEQVAAQQDDATSLGTRRDQWNLNQDKRAAYEQQVTEAQARRHQSGVSPEAWTAASEKLEGKHKAGAVAAARQTAADDRFLEDADIRLRQHDINAQSEMERMQAAQDAITTRQHAAQGGATHTDPATGRSTITRHEDGDRKFDAGAISQPRMERTPEADIASVPGMGALMTLGGPVRHEAPVQDFRDDRGNIATLPAEEKTDPATGEIYSETKDEYGQTARISVGQDPKIPKLNQIGRDIDLRQAELDNLAIAEQQVGPRFKLAEDTYRKAKTQIDKPLPFIMENGEWKENTPVGYHDEKGKWIDTPRFPADQQKLAIWRQEREAALNQYKSVARQYGEQAPAWENIQKQKAALTLQRDQLRLQKKRVELDLPDEDGGIAATLDAAETGQPPAEHAAITEHLRDLASVPGMGDMISTLTGQAEVQLLPETPAGIDHNPPLVPQDDPAKAALFAQAFGGVIAPEELTVRNTSEDLMHIYRGNNYFGQIGLTHRDRSPYIVVNAASSVEIQRQISFGKTQGVDVYLSAAPGLVDPHKEAEWAASVFHGAMNIQDDDDRVAYMEAQGAGPEEILRKVKFGELALNRGEVLMQNLWGGTFKADDPTAPGAFDRYLHEQAPREVQRAWSAARSSRDTGAKNEVMQNYLDAWQAQNAWKPGVTLKSRLEYEKALKLKPRTGEQIANLASEFGVIAMQSVGMVAGLASAPVAIPVNAVFNPGDNQKWAKQIGRGYDNTNRMWYRAGKRHLTEQGEETFKQRDQAREAIRIAVASQDWIPGGRESPEWREQLDAAIRAATDNADTIHGWNREEGWETTREDIDPATNKQLSQLIETYALTGNVELLDAFMRAQLDDHGTRQAEKYNLDLAAGRNKFIAAFIQGTHAPPQELGTEALTTVAGGVFGKVLFGAGKAASAVKAAKHMSQLRDASSSGSRLAKFRLKMHGFKGEFLAAGMVPNTLANPASTLGKAQNLAVKGGKFTMLTAPTGGIEEGIMGAANPDASTANILHDAVLGMVLEPLLGGMMAVPMIGASTINQKFQTSRTIAKFSDAYNREFTGTDGFVPLTPQKAQAAMALFDSVNLNASAGRLLDAVEAVKQADIAAAADTAGPAEAQALQKAIANYREVKDTIAESVFSRLEAVQHAESVQQADRPLAYAIAKVSAGRPDLLTPQERSAGAGAVDGAGAPVFATNANGIDILTDQGRAHAMVKFPGIGMLIQTAESERMVVEQAAADAQAAAGVAPVESLTGDQATQSGQTGKIVRFEVDESTRARAQTVSAAVMEQVAAQYPGLAAILEPDAPANPAQLGGGVEMAFTEEGPRIRIVPDDVAQQIAKNPDATDEQIVQSLVESIAIHETAHVAQENAAVTEADARGIAGTRLEKFKAIYTERAAEYQQNKEVWQIGAELYGRNSVDGADPLAGWTQLSPWAQAAEIERMFAESLLKGDTTDALRFMSASYGKVKEYLTQLAAKILAYIKGELTDADGNKITPPPAIVARAQQIADAVQAIQQGTNATPDPNPSSPNPDNRPSKPAASQQGAGNGPTPEADSNNQPANDGGTKPPPGDGTRPPAVPGQIDQRISKALESRSQTVRDAAAKITNRGANIVFAENRADAAAKYGLPDNGRTTTPVAKAFRRTDGTSGVVLFPAALQRNDAGLTEVMDHELVHLAEYEFESTPEGAQLASQAQNAFDPQHADFDADLDKLMRKEYPSWDSLTPQSKLREATRAAVEAANKGETSHFKKGIFSYLKAFLAHVQKVLGSDTAISAYIAYIQKNLGIDSSAPATPAAAKLKAATVIKAEFDRVVKAYPLLKKDPELLRGLRENSIDLAEDIMDLTEAEQRDLAKRAVNSYVQSEEVSARLGEIADARSAKAKAYRAERQRLVNAEADRVIKNTIAINVLLDHGRIEAPPRNFGRIVIKARKAKKDPKIKLTPAQQAAYDKFGGENYDGMPSAVGYPGAGKNAVAREIIRRIFAPFGQGIAPDDVVGPLGFDKGSELMAALTGEIESYVRGAETSNLLDPDADLTDAEMAEAEFKAEQDAFTDAWRVSTGNQNLSHNRAKAIAAEYDAIVEQDGEPDSDFADDDYISRAVAAADAKAAAEAEARKPKVPIDTTPKVEDDGSIFAAVDLGNEVVTTPTEADKAAAEKWANSMPGFQGGKRPMAAPVTAAVRAAFSPEKRSTFRTIVDFFGGGGSWGLFHAMVNFDNVNRVVVYERNSDRLLKIKLFHEKGNLVAGMLQQKNVQDILLNAAAKMRQSGTKSGSALAKRIDTTGISDPLLLGLFQAIRDYAENSYAGAKDKAGEQTPEQKIATSIRIVGEQAADAYRLAEAFRQRGGKVDYRNADSYQAAPESGTDVLSVIDPPYYRTKGYTFEESVPDAISGQVMETVKENTVKEDTYRLTRDLIQRAAAAGNSMIYTDSAFWKMEETEKRGKKTITHPPYFGMPEKHRRFYLPEGGRILSDIVDSFDSFGVVDGEIGAGRKEILGIHGHDITTQPGRRTRPQRNARNNEGQGSPDRRDDQRAGRGDDSQQAVPGMAEGIAGEADSLRGESGDPLDTGDDGRLGAAPAQPRKVWRGEPMSPKPKDFTRRSGVYSGEAHGVGKYYGIDPDAAERFSKKGTVKESEVTLSRPLILSSDADVTRARQDAARITDQAIDDHPGHILDGNEAFWFTRAMLELGYDGLITEHKEAPGGRQLVVFDANAVNFTPPTLASAPAQPSIAERMEADFGPLTPQNVFGSWGASTTEPGIRYGYRGERANGQADNNFGASEGVGLYLARDEKDASFFGKARKVAFPEPKRPLIVDQDGKGDNIPMLEEGNDVVWDHIWSHKPAKTDSDWIKAHVLAAKQLGMTQENSEGWDTKLPRAITDILLSMGYDAVYVRSAGMQWTSILAKPNQRFNRGTRSEGGTALYAAPAQNPGAEYRYLKAKEEKAGLTPAEQQALLKAEKAMGQSFAIDMDDPALKARKGSVTPSFQPTLNLERQHPITGQQLALFSAPAQITFEKQMDLEEDANGWIKDALETKNPPKTTGEAWEMFRSWSGNKTRGTQIVNRKYFDSAWRSFTDPTALFAAPAQRVQEDYLGPVTEDMVGIPAESLVYGIGQAVYNIPETASKGRIERWLQAQIDASYLDGTEGPLNPMDIDPNELTGAQEAELYERVLRNPMAMRALEKYAEAAAKGSPNETNLADVARSYVASAMLVPRTPQGSALFAAPAQKANDTEYLALAKDPEKNREKLQAMVDEAARGAGSETGFIHGTAAKDSFDRFDSEGATERGTFWFEKKSGESAYGRTMRVALRFANPFNAKRLGGFKTAGEWVRVFKEKGITGLEIDPAFNWNEFGHLEHVSDSRKRTAIENLMAHSESPHPLFKNLRQVLVNAGYDGLLLPTEAFQFHNRSKRKPGSNAVAFYPNQIKSADPVTYDASGNVIPLSQRFNPESDSILFVAPAQPNAEAALDDALKGMDPIYLKVLKASQRTPTPTPQELAAEFKLPEKGIRNIIGTARMRIQAFARTRSAQGLQPARAKDGALAGGRPDLGYSTVPTLAAVDQLRNQEGLPLGRSNAEIRESAQSIVARPDAIEFLIDEFQQGRRSPESFAAANSILLASSLKGVQSPRLTELAITYRETGTTWSEEGRARIDIHRTPAERNALFFAEMLTAPNKRTMKAWKEAKTPEQKSAVLEAWNAQVRGVKDALKNRGIDLDAALARLDEHRAAVTAATTAASESHQKLVDALRADVERLKGQLEATTDAAAKQAAQAQVEAAQEKAEQAAALDPANTIRLEMEKLDKSERTAIEHLREDGSTWESASIRSLLSVADVKKTLAKFKDALATAGMQAILLAEDIMLDRQTRLNAPAANAPAREQQAYRMAMAMVDNLGYDAGAIDRRSKGLPPKKKRGQQAQQSAKPEPAMMSDAQLQAYLDNPQRWRPLWQWEMAMTGQTMTFEEWSTKPAHQARKRQQQQFWKEPVSTQTGELDMNNPLSVKRAFDEFNIHSASLFDKAIAFWRMSILSGPQTGIVNFGGNILHSIYNLGPRRILEAGVNDALGIIGLGSKDAATLGELRIMAQQMHNALAKGGTDLMRSWAMDDRIVESEVLAYGKQMEFSGVGADYIPKAIGGPIGAIMHAISFRHMTAADEMLKSFHGHIEVGAIAYRMAKAEGLKGDAMEPRIKELMEYGSSAWLKAFKAAEWITFQTPVDRKNQRTIGFMDRAASALRRMSQTDTGRTKVIPKIVNGKIQKVTVPILKPNAFAFFFPFINTPLNIFKIGIEMSPLGVFFSAVDAARALKIRISNKQLTPEAAAAEASEIYNRLEFVKDVTNQIIGAGMFWALGTLVKPDDEEDRPPFLTGSRDWKRTSRGDRQMRERVMPAYSVRIGDTIFSYQRIEPFGTALAFLVDLRVAIDKHGMSDAALGEFMTTAINQMDNKTYMQGVSDLFNAIHDPERFGTNLTSGIITGYVPNLIRQPIREADPYLRDTRPSADEGFLEGVINRLGYSLAPGYAPIAMDVWGNPIVKHPGRKVGGATSDLLLRIFDPTNLTLRNSIDPIDLYLFNWNNSRALPKERFNIEPIRKNLQIPHNGTTHTVAISDEDHLQANRTAGQSARSMLGNEWDASDVTPEGVERIKDVLQKFQKRERDRLRDKYRRTLPVE